jgi:Type I phosphodiesterase / nucleotide pyrophosphatase
LRDPGDFGIAIDLCLIFIMEHFDNYQKKDKQQLHHSCNCCLDNMNLQQSLVNKAQQEAIFDKTNTRHDLLTFLTAKEYIRMHQPKVVFLGLGETDEAAHHARYDTYLEKAMEADRMIAELWHWAQTTPGYKDNTTFIITTDHGRGMKAASWPDHGMFVDGSSQTWLAVIGPTIKPAGEIKDNQQIYQEQLAQTIAVLLGEEFVSNQPVASAVQLR